MVTTSTVETKYARGDEGVHVPTQGRKASPNQRKEKNLDNLPSFSSLKSTLGANAISLAFESEKFPSVSLHECLP